MLVVTAHPTGHADGGGFDVAQLSDVATVVLAPDGTEHVVLSDGYRRIRIDVARGTVCQGPVRLDYMLKGFNGIEAKILTLRRLIGLYRLGHFIRHLHPPERRAPRWIAALRAHDAARDGASQRDIAIALYGSKLVGSNWGRGSDFLRLRVQRLVRTGHHMAQGGYRTLLR